MGRKRAKRRQAEAPVPDAAETPQGRAAADATAGLDGAAVAAKRDKTLRKRIATLDDEVGKARRRLDRRREALADAEREVRALERELAAALREARSLGVIVPGTAGADPGSPAASTPGAAHRRDGRPAGPAPRPCAAPARARRDGRPRPDGRTRSGS